MNDSKVTKLPTSFKFLERPQRFIEPIVMETINSEKGIFKITIMLQLTKEELLKDERKCLIAVLEEYYNEL